MFRHLLVAVDGSRQAESIVPCAVELEKRASARITVVLVVPRNAAELSEWGAMGKRRLSAGNSSPDLPEAEAYLERLAGNVRACGVRVDTDLREGDAPVEILRAARDSDADTIAIATQPRRGVDRLMTASVAERVANGTTLPMIVLSAKA